MFIVRTLSGQIKEKLQKSNKIIVLLGAHQTGKTTLSQKIIADLKLKTLSISGDEIKYTDVLSSQDLKKLSSLITGYKLLFIDEAQKIPNIGINLKILHDNIPNLKILATGSSSFDLTNKISEPLTGRAWNYKLFPISFLELSANHNEFELRSQLEERLIYGSYPEIFSIKNDQEKEEYLNNLSTEYLFKDVLELATIKHSPKLRDLLKLLAFQIGSEVSISELSNSLDIAKTTVDHYIDLLEKSFVLFRLSGLSRNLRKEVSKMDKIYFYDNGIRNTIVDNIKPLKDRDDHGKLWENFLMSERKKLLNYQKISASTYFWRVYTGSEIDYVEERGGKLFGYEFKWSPKKIRPPQTWHETYKNSKFLQINSENFLQFILKK